MLVNNDKDTNKFKVGYWSLKKKDLTMIRLGEERAEVIFNEVEKLTKKYTRGSYEYIENKDQDNKKDQRLYSKSNQRIDFMRNVYVGIIKLASSKLTELEAEIEKRRYSC